MTLLDLSAVTQALTNFIERSVENSPAWQPRARPTTSPLPPDQVNNAGISFYLYHLVENPHLRTPPPVDPAATHVRHSPMALDLYYQMTAVPGGSTSTELLESQLLMGCALKALHDEPVIDDATLVNGAEILKMVGLDGSGNHIRMTLQPIASHDAVTYWTAGSQSLRLAAYYQASVMLLEPEVVRSRASKVFQYGVGVTTLGGPYVTRSESVTEFTSPDGVAHQVESSPATVFYGGEITLYGTNLSSDATELLLRGGGSNIPRAVDTTWGLTDQPTRVVATLRETIDGDPLVPGVYAAAVRTTNTVSGNTLRQTSNETPIQIAPAVTSITLISGSRYGIEGVLFSDDHISTDQVEAYLGSDQLSRVTSTPGAGEFQVVDEHQIELTLPSDAATGDQLPVRIIVNGAESPPRWLEVP